MLAKAARDAGAIYCLSTVAGESTEAVGHAAPGSWFRLDTPNDADMRRDLLSRAKAAGFEALDAGVDGIVASNHDGRQLDPAPASIDMLPLAVEAVNGRAAILMDSGLRGGADIARALAPGADAALLGRPFLRACAAGGDASARHAFDILGDDLRNVMHQLGCARPADLTATLTEGPRR